MTKLLIGRLPGPAAVTVETYRFLTMSGYDVLTRTVVMAYFDDLYICYEEETEVVLAIAVLGESVGRRLRKKGLAGRTVTLKLKYSYGSGRSAQRKLAHPTDDENIFVPVATGLLDSIWSPGMPVRLAGIGLSGFDMEGGIQTDLFCEVDERGAVASSRRDLSIAMDAVRERFGDAAVGYGRATDSIPT